MVASCAKPRCELKEQNRVKASSGPLSLAISYCVCHPYCDCRFFEDGPPTSRPRLWSRPSPSLRDPDSAPQGDASRSRGLQKDPLIVVHVARVRASPSCSASWSSQSGTLVMLTEGDAG